MEVKPQSSQSAIDTIPEGWDVKTLRETLEYEQPTAYLVRDSEYADTGVPVLTAGKTFILGYTHEQEGICTDLPVILFDDFTTASRYVDFPFKVKSSATKLLRARDPQADLRFVFDRMQLLRFVLGGHKRHYISEYQHLRVAMPPLREQRAIAAVLSDVEALITALDRLIAKKRAIKRGAMQQLLTGRTRLPGFSGPWEVKTIGDTLEYEQPTAYLVRDSEYADTGVPVLTAGKTFILGYTDEQEGICTDLPVILFDDFTTASRYVDFPFKVKSSATKLLRARDPQVDLHFVFERMQLLRFVLGGHKRHYISEYQHLCVAMPSLPEQRAIAAVLSDMDAEIAALKARRDKTRALKKGMMQELLTGKTRLI